MKIKLPFGASPKENCLDKDEGWSTSRIRWSASPEYTF